jgi:hypothetical protein
MKISIDTFTGMAPKVGPHLLPAQAAQRAVNVKLVSGAIQPVNKPKLVFTGIIGNAKSVFMLGVAGSAVPISWATDVDVASSPVPDDEYRIYYTGDGAPKKTSVLLCGSPVGGPTAWYNLGVPAPASAPSAAATTGSVPAGTYVYVYTYVTQFGATLLEESAPSNPVTITLGAAGGVALTGLANPVSSTNYNFVYKRIYRSTGTTLQLVAQIPVATTTYTDTLSATSILGDALATAGWLPPPADLKGITSLPSSVLVGFRGNEVWFSEPGFPHAWPLQYMQSLDSQIIGLKAFGNNIVIATQMYPYAASGLHPSAFTLQKLPLLEPCLSKRSLVSDEFGALYASANGLVSITSDASGLASAQVLSRDTFAQFYPSTITAAVFERRYYGFYDSPSGGAGGFIFTREDAGPITVTDVQATAVHVDQATAQLLFVNKVDGDLYQYDPIDSAPFRFLWKSKVFILESAANLGCFRISGPELTHADNQANAAIDAINAGVIAANNVLYASGDLGIGTNALVTNSDVNGVNGSSMEATTPYPLSTFDVVVSAGGVDVSYQTCVVNKLYRLPSGFRNTGWEIAISGQREVRGIDMAISPQELRNG